MRALFSDGQEITSTDYNRISTVLHKEIYNDLLFAMLNGETDAFFGEGFKAFDVNEFTVEVGAGFGLQSFGGNILPMKLTAPMRINIPPPADALGMTIQARSIEVDSERGLRLFKDLDTDAIVERETVLSRDWSAEVVLKVAQATTVPPDPDPGFVAIAQLRVAPAGIASFQDVRKIFPTPKVGNNSGNLAYEHVVGSELGGGVTHLTLQTAIQSAQEGDRILVLTNLAIAPREQVIEVGKNNIEIDFKLGTTLFSFGNFQGLEPQVGMRVTGNGCVIKNPTFKDFGPARPGPPPTDVAGFIDEGEGTMLLRPRFDNCAENIIGDPYVDFEREV